MRRPNVWPLEGERRPLLPQTSAPPVVPVAAHPSATVSSASRNSRPPSHSHTMASSKGIPSWQRAQAQPPAPVPTEADVEMEGEEPHTDTDADADAATGAPDTVHETAPDDQPLLDHASKFLDDPAVRDASREKKIEFLQSKGVDEDHAERLLASQPPRPASTGLTDLDERAWPSASRPQSQSQSQSQSQPRDVPPIVTYPEFLAQPTQQPPLITTSRLLNTAYIAGGLVATLYGLSKYLVAPMTQGLTDSRHDFAQHTQEQLDKLNDRLRDAASVDPAAKAKTAASDVADDVSDADSDPTELFHRDFGTQTTPTLSRRDSESSQGAHDNESLVKSHQSRLNILTSHLRELEATRSNDTASFNSLKTQLSDLQTYLSDMSYQNQYYPGSGGFYGSTYGLPKSKDGKDDQIEVLKNDIRAVKGVFLSARNFPAGGRNTTPLGKIGAS